MSLCSCGKTQINSNQDSASSITNNNSGSLITCGSNLACKQACDSEGSGVYKNECDYETRNNLAQHFSCDHLKACYGKLISSDSFK